MILGIICICIHYLYGYRYTVSGFVHYVVIIAAGYRVVLRISQSEGVWATFRDKNICLSSCNGTGFARSVPLVT